MSRLALGGLVCAALAGLCVWIAVVSLDEAERPEPLPAPRVDDPRPVRMGGGQGLTTWWDALPRHLQRDTVPSGAASNIHPADYTGPDTCRECHPENHALWSEHSHRRMNALATEATVKGDFADATISYRGGTVTFYRQEGRPSMRLERGTFRRVYEITETIGSRFFQYYVGKQLAGPEPRGHRFYTENHVLPFGYWLARKEWVPVVHIGREVADEHRPDPFAPPDEGEYYAPYAAGCNYCHSTFPLSDMFLRRARSMGKHAPLRMHWSIKGYLEETHPGKVATVSAVVSRGDAGPRPKPELVWPVSRYAVTYGISCEACHLGARQHVESEGEIPPKFFPASPHLRVQTRGPLDFGRSHANVNWACGRCHTGARPTFAAGMSTWNSVEYDDAMKGSCYSELRCIDCHNPHRTIGPEWSPSADEDDALCLECHDHLKPAEQRVRHTHHPAGSAGARCMNCHMPRINEGMQDLVRTHMIYSPTRADMIEANQPNACNLCHTDKSIDWTRKHLADWYGARYSETKIADNYPHRSEPVAIGWLKSRSDAVRLVAADALFRTRSRQALPHLIRALDDSHMVNRQFAGMGLEEMMNIRLADFGYRFYMTRAERRRPLARLRAELPRSRK